MQDPKLATSQMKTKRNASRCQAALNCTSRHGYVSRYKCGQSIFQCLKGVALGPSPRYIPPP